MNIIIPISVTDAMIGAATVPEPASYPSPGEWQRTDGLTYLVNNVVNRSNLNRRYRCLTEHVNVIDTTPPPEANPTFWEDLGEFVGKLEAEWSAQPYREGDVRIRASTHRTYRCTVNHDSGGPPETDGTRWQDIGPTNRWAALDKYTNTRSVADGTLTFVVSPGYANSVALYGLIGSGYAITVRDEPGGDVIFSRTGFLSEDPEGWYEYLFVAPRQKEKLVFFDIPIRPAAEFTVTVTTGSGQIAAIGTLVFGDLMPVGGSTTRWDGTEFGASAEPVTYSYINTDEYGVTTIVRRHSATNMRGTIKLPRQFADAAVRMLQSVLDVPVACIATTKGSGYDGLNVFGLISSAPVTYDNYYIASIEYNVKGLT